MSGRGVLAALAGGLGLVALVITTAVVGAVALVALPPAGRAEDTPSPTPTVPAETVPAAPAAPAPPRELVVALAPGDLAMQAGVVRGRDVLLARGLEVEVARAVAERLGIERVRFVHVGAAERFLSADPGAWQLAVAGIRSVRATTSRASYSRPYLTTDQLVLLRRGTARPRRLADLRTRILCAVRGTDAATAAASVRAARPVVLAVGGERLVQLVQTGACDAAVVDPVQAGRLVEGRTALLGPYVARIRFGTGLVIAVRRDGDVPLRAIDRALARLRANGALSNLARYWLGLDPASLPLLR